MENIENCKTLNEAAILLFGKKNYTNRQKVKKILEEKGTDWQEWKKEKKIKKYCLNCGEELKKGQYKFCSSSCAATYNNKLRLKKIKEKKVIKEEKIKEKRYCKFCGKELKKNQKNYCSQTCFQKQLHKEYIERWKNGEERGMKGEYGTSSIIKQYLREKYNNSCQICGWHEINKYTNNVPLEVHHIDGDYTNNKEENLQLLCPNCHSLTETFKAHNKNGRKGRNKYN